MAPPPVRVVADALREPLAVCAPAAPAPQRARRSPVARRRAAASNRNPVPRRSGAPADERRTARPAPAAETAHHRPAPPPQARPGPTAPAAPRLRAASVSRRCASPDPGEALACADPTLGAAQRRLESAYREAEAAGAPPEQLERQQQRWLAARAAAALQTPWAMRDIYLARIAELEDQARQAANKGE
jgi:hypothetical protein